MQFMSISRYTTPQQNGIKYFLCWQPAYTVKVTGIRKLLLSNLLSLSSPWLWEITIKSNAEFVARVPR